LDYHVGSTQVSIKLFIALFSLYLSLLHNYFDGPTKLLLNLYLTKLLDTSAKSFFPYVKVHLQKSATVDQLKTNDLYLWI